MHRAGVGCVEDAYKISYGVVLLLAVRSEKKQGENAQMKTGAAFSAEALSRRQGALHVLVVTVCGGRPNHNIRVTGCLIDTHVIQRPAGPDPIIWALHALSKEMLLCTQILSAFTCTHLWSSTGSIQGYILKAGTSDMQPVIHQLQSPHAMHCQTKFGRCWSHVRLASFPVNSVALRSQLSLPART